jgi:hypothetical protein
MSRLTAGESQQMSIMVMQETMSSKTPISCSGPELYPYTGSVDVRNEIIHYDRYFSCDLSSVYRRDITSSNHKRKWKTETLVRLQSDMYIFILGSDFTSCYHIRLHYLNLCPAVADFTSNTKVKLGHLHPFIIKLIFLQRNRYLQGARYVYRSLKYTGI